MLRKLTVSGFKSYVDPVDVEFAPLTVVFGPNAGGKSNLLDALVALSRLATSHTLAEALSGPVRGHPLELFSLPPTGLSGLMKKALASFRIEAELHPAGLPRAVRYCCEIGIDPRSGTLSLRDEYLARLDKRGTPHGRPLIERQDQTIRVRRKSKPAHPWEERVGLHYTCLSNRKYSGREYEAIQETRSSLASIRAYYLDPRVAMRQGRPPKEVEDIGPLGEDLGPFLYRLQAERPRHFDALKRTLQRLIPSVGDLRVALDDKRGLIDVEIVQEGIPYSIRVVSEGTLRLLALVSLAVNPWGGTLVAFEEPENGVHPARLELVTQILLAMALDERRPRQVLVTSHSPQFCGTALRLARRHSGRVSLLRATRSHGRSLLTPLDVNAPLFDDTEIKEALSSATEDGVFQGLWVRGLLDD